MLTFEHVRKNYDSKRVLEDCSISFATRESVCPCWTKRHRQKHPDESGCRTGKTQRRHTHLQGAANRNREQKHIAYMSTEPFYYDYMRIRDVKAFHKDFFADFDADLFDRLLTFMELTPDLKIRALSSGMAAKLKIAVTLSRRAEVIMLDEPLNGIDLIGRDQIIHTIIQATGSGATFIISSHLFDELEPIVDNVVMMKGGKVILEGELEAIRAEHGKSISDLYREIYADTAVPQF